MDWFGRNEKFLIGVGMIVVIPVTGLTMAIMAKCGVDSVSITVVGGFGAVILPILYTAFQNAKHVELCHVTQDKVDRNDAKVDMVLAAAVKAVDASQVAASKAQEAKVAASITGNITKDIRDDTAAIRRKTDSDPKPLA